MTFSVVGTGNIAWFIGRRLVNAGHKCTGVYGRNASAVRELASNLHTEYYGIDDIQDAIADVCFLAVSDAAIADIVPKISFRQTTLVHMAGAVPINVLNGAAVNNGVIWPIYSISKEQLPSHNNIPCVWEAATSKAQQVIMDAGSALTDILFEAKYEQRQWMHLSAVIGNNFVNHLLAICEQICTTNNLPFSALQPIIEQTLTRIKYASPANMQTGPAVRNDSNTINRQLELLNGHPEWQMVYSAVTESIQKFYKQ